MLIKRGGLVLLSTLLATSFVSLNTFADETASSTFSINVSDAALQLSVPSSASITLNPTSSAAVFGSTTITANVATNNALGYTLTMTPTNSAGNTDLISSTVSSSIQTLSSSEEGYTEQSFTANKWGYRLSSNENYFGVPSTLAPDAWVTNGPTNGTDHNITLAAKVDGTFPASEYTTTLVFNAVAKKGAINPEEAFKSDQTKQKKNGYYKIQDYDDTICNLVEVFDADSQYQVIDDRDNNVYWTAKLKDGHCWMTQNLDLDLTNGVALTNATTDLGWNGTDYDAASWSPNKTTYKYEDGTGDSWVSYDYGAFSFDPGDHYQQPEYFTGTSCDYLTDSTCTIFSDSPYSGNGTHGHVGNYYSWSAAVATNDGSVYTTETPTNSICPKNWRLPDASANNDYAVLNSLYNNDSSTSDEGLYNSPIYLVRGAYVASDTGPGSNAGILMDYLSSTSASNSTPFHVWSSPGYFNANYASMPKFLEHSVRCLARSNVTPKKQFIIYNANGGAGTMPTQVLEYGSTANLTANSFTREYYTFNGWNTKQNGTGTSYSDEDSFSAASAVTILYAQWKKERITIERAYEYAYAEHQLGMYQETANGSGDYIRVTPEQYNGNDRRYAMQDIELTHHGTKICDLVNVVGDQYRALDIRDNNIYYIGKLDDGHCWMTQNLDLELSDQEVLTHSTSDIGWGSDTTTLSWKPDNSTIDFDGSTTIRADWTGDRFHPYSANPGPIYVVPSDSSTDARTLTYTLEDCQAALTSETNEDCRHFSTGNYYNWTAAIASNDSSQITSQYDTAPNSICPRGWRLPIGKSSSSLSASTAELAQLFYRYNITYNLQSNTYRTSDGYHKLQHAPLFLTQTGYYIGGFNRGGGWLWSSSAESEWDAYSMVFSYNNPAPISYVSRNTGLTIRCLAR